MAAVRKFGVEDGIWEETKPGVSRMRARKPAIRVSGSNIVKTKRGIGGRIEDMMEITVGVGTQINDTIH